MAKKKPQIQPQVKTTQNQAEPFYRRHWLPIVIFCFTFLLYSNSITNGYNLDDELVTRNHKLTSQGISAIPEILSSPYYQDRMGYSYDYRPVVLISFAIEHQFFGDNPYLGHFINILLFACICLLMYSIFSRLWRTGTWFVLCAILIFAAHPIHTEVVCSLKNRDELLALLFALAAFHFYLKYYERQGVLYLLFGALMMALAYFSKLSALSFSVIIPVALLFFRQRQTAKLVVIYLTSLLPGLLINPVATVKLDLEMVLITSLAITLVALLLDSRAFKEFVSQKLGAIRSSKPDPSPVNFSATDKSDDENNAPFALKSLFEVKNWLATGVLSIVIVVGITEGLPYLILSAQVALAILYYRGNRYQQWFAYILLTSTLLFDFIAINRVRGMHTSFYLTSIWIAANATRKQGLYYFPSLAFLIICFGSILIFGKEDWVLPVAIFLLPFVNTRWLRMVIIGGAAIKLLNVITDASALNSKIIGLLFSVLYVGYALIVPGIKYRIRLKALSIATLIGCFAVLVLQLNSLNPGAKLALVHWKNYSVVHTLQIHQGDINKVASTPANVVNVNSNRPLSLVETPVGYEDSPGKKLGTSMIILLKYLKLLIIPHPLLFYYGYRIIEPTDLLSPWAILGFVVYLGLAVFAFYNIHKNKILAFGIIAFLTAIAPFSNLLFMLPGAMGERFLLAPSIGFSVVMAVLIFAIFKVDKNEQGLESVGNARYATLVILLIFGGLTFFRNFDWKDDLTLFKHDVKNGGESFMQNNMLGVHLAKQAETLPTVTETNNMRLEAVGYFKKAYSIYPGVMNTPYDIGRCYSLMNMPDSALPWFLIAHQLDSTYTEIDWSAAIVYMSLRNSEKALPFLQTVMKRGLHQPDIYPFLSMAYYNMGMYEKSIAVNRNCIERFPNNFNAYINIGKTYHAINQIDSELVYYRRARSINPNDPNLNAAIQQLEQSKH